MNYTRALLAGLQPIGDGPVTGGQGIYLICLSRGASLPRIVVNPEGVLYVGMTEDDLTARNHLSYRHSGFSTLRRSLGALLQAELDLAPMPRGSGRAASNAINFRFQDSGEARLTDWMHKSLLAAQVALIADVRRTEADLISELKPPLNLTGLSGWRNPQRSFVMAERKACADAARRLLN